MAFMMPILSVLFGEKTTGVITKPIYSGNLGDLKQFFSDYSAYYMNELSPNSRTSLCVSRFSVSDIY